MIRGLILLVHLLVQVLVHLLVHLLGHLLRTALVVAAIWLGVLEIELAGWLISNYEPGISVVVILCMAGFGAVALYLGTRMFFGVRDSFRDMRWRWPASRDRADAGLPRARLVSR